VLNGNIFQILILYSEPWSAHLLGEIGNERSVPILCPNFCSIFYLGCKDVLMNAQFSPFGVPLIGIYFMKKHFKNLSKCMA